MEKLFKQDGDVKREYTEDEYAQHALDVAAAQAAALAAENAASIAALQKKALLEKLGITEDEAKLLLTPTVEIPILHEA